MYLNQIAKYFNTGGTHSQAMENEIHQCISDLFLLRKKVLEMAGDKYFNTGGTHSQDMENEIHQCISDLFLLRKKVLEMAGDFHGDTKTHQK